MGEIKESVFMKMNRLYNVIGTAAAQLAGKGDVAVVKGTVGELLELTNALKGTDWRAEAAAGLSAYEHNRADGKASASTIKSVRDSLDIAYMPPIWVSHGEQGMRVVDGHGRILGLLQRAMSNHLAAAEKKAVVKLIVVRSADFLPYYQRLNAGEGHSTRMKVTNPDLPAWKHMSARVEKAGLDSTEFAYHAITLFDMAFLARDYAPISELFDLFPKFYSVRARWAPFLQTCVEELNNVSAARARRFDSALSFVAAVFASDKLPRQARKSRGLVAFLMLDHLSERRLADLPVEQIQQAIIKCPSIYLDWVKVIVSRRQTSGDIEIRNKAQAKLYAAFERARLRAP